MDATTYGELSKRYPILEKIGFEEYQIKIWIMAHMDMQDKIDIQGFGKFSCKSFMQKGKSYHDLIQQVEDLVLHEVLFVIDKHASIKEYRFAGEAQYEFQKLILGAVGQFRNKGTSELTNLFRSCLTAENEPSFIGENLQEFFTQTQKDPKKIKDFLNTFLIANASAYALFILGLLIHG